jgi:V8-like Glu-specific endopeptidase
MSSQIGVGSSSTLEEDGAAASSGAQQSRPGQRRGLRRPGARAGRRPGSRHERHGPGGPRPPAAQRPAGRRRDRHGRRADGPAARCATGREAARRRRRWLAGVTLCALVAVALLLHGSPSGPPSPGPAGAGAKPSDGGAPAAPVASQPQSQSDEELASYWTADRRARAVDGDVAERTGPGTGDDDRVPLAGAAVAPYHGGGLAARAEGALFSTIRGVDYACSGTVVNSPGGDLVLTAGHCLHEGAAAGGFASNVIFIPGYANGTTPYGIWHARQLTVTNAWGYQQDFDQDAGFAAFRPLGGQTLGAVTGGGLPIGFGTGWQPQTVLGYPKLPPYDGATLMSCSGSPRPDPNGGTSLGVACAMTAGASGGAWVTGLAGGTGTVDSVVSYAYAGDPGTIYGTWFGPEIQGLYPHAIGL